MTTTRDDILSFALGQLAPADEARVRAALEADPALMDDYHADLAALHALPDELPPQAVPAGAEERLMARLRREQAHARPNQVLPAAPPAPAAGPARHLNWRLMLLSVVAALTLGVLFLRPQPPQDLLSQYSAAPGAQMQPLTANGQDVGQLIRLPDGRAYVHLNVLAPENRVYQLWRIEDGKPVSAGVFDGQGIVIARAQAGQTVAVSVEPVGGSEQPTTTPILVKQL